MRVRKNPMTPLAAVVTGLLAGAAGTVTNRRRSGIRRGRRLLQGQMWP